MSTRYQRLTKSGGPKGFQYYYGTIEKEVIVGGTPSDPDYDYNGIDFEGFIFMGNKHGKDDDPWGEKSVKRYCLSKVCSKSPQKIKPFEYMKTEASIRVILPVFNDEHPLFNGVYTGELQNGIPHGNGEFIFNFGLLYYVGEFLDGTFCGQGKLYCAEYSQNSVGMSLIYDGGWKDCDFNGHGVEYYYNGEVKTEGEWKDGELTSAKIYAYGRLIYEGGIKNGLYHGIGTIYNNDSDNKPYWHGEFKDGKRSSPLGKYEYAPPLYHALHGFKGIYTGEMLNEKPAGFGKFVSDDGILLYEGEWDGDNLKAGKLYYPNGNLKYDGSFLYDRPYGDEIGRLYRQDGTLAYEGSYTHGSSFDGATGNGKLYAEDGVTVIYEGFVGKGKPWQESGAPVGTPFAAPDR